MDYFEKSLVLHEQLRGKLSVVSKAPVDSIDDLSVWYTPGVAAPCEAIAKDPATARGLTIKNNCVAVVSDGSAVLGLGNIGPLAAIPVMEGKALLFQQLAGIDAWPICLDATDADRIIDTIRAIAPVFGGINLEDISAPRCFEVEERLQDLGIPVFHDDQHGTAIILLAALINACRVTGRSLADLKIIINGAGAAGTAIARLLMCDSLRRRMELKHSPQVILCDSKGAISAGREGLSGYKKDALRYSNPENINGTVYDVLRGADVFIGVSRGNLIKGEHVRTMNKDPIVLAMANPVPEIMPDEAREAGAAIVGTGRSDFPNQINNVLVFPGIFRGALDARATAITENMKVSSALALANAVPDPAPDRVVPAALDKTVVPKVAAAVAEGVKEGSLKT